MTDRERGVKTASGRYLLDIYCNDIDANLSRIRDELDIDTKAIPSDAQRQAFEFMRSLLTWAMSFSGSLRYDVNALHTDCPEHDEHVLAKIQRCRAALTDQTGRIHVDALHEALDSLSNDIDGYVDEADVIAAIRGARSN